MYHQKFQGRARKAAAPVYSRVATIFGTQPTTSQSILHALYCCCRALYDRIWAMRR